MAVRERMKRLKNQENESHKQHEENHGVTRTATELRLDKNEDGMLSLEEMSHVLGDVYADACQVFHRFPMISLDFSRFLWISFDIH